MPGVMETLNFFYERQILMGICTNKRQFVAEKLIKQMKLSKFFTTIVGARNNMPLKPNPSMLFLTMKGFKTKNNLFYMVGDTSNDIDAATAANIKSIVVAGGYTNKDIYKLEATHVLKNMRDIIKLLGLS